MYPAGRISVDPDKRDGKPGVRDTVFTVSAVLLMLAAQGSTERLVQRVPDLDAADVKACLNFAAAQVDRPIPVAVPFRLKLTLAGLLVACFMLVWVSASPGAPLWVVGLASLGTVVGVWGVVSISYPVHSRRSESG